MKTSIRQYVAGTQEGVLEGLLDIATAIHPARKGAGLTHEDLLHLAHNSERTIRAIESGKGNPRMRAVLAAVNVLGLRSAATQ